MKRIIVYGVLDGIEQVVYEIKAPQAFVNDGTGTTRRIIKGMCDARGVSITSIQVDAGMTNELM